MSFVRTVEQLVRHFVQAWPCGAGMRHVDGGLDAITDCHVLVDDRIGRDLSVLARDLDAVLVLLGLRGQTVQVF